MIRALIFLLIAMTVSRAVCAESRAGTGQLLLTPQGSEQAFEALLLDTEAEIEVTAMTARVTLRQTFQNNTADWVEGRYVFPLPEQAAVYALTLKIGDRVIVGEIQERQQARQTYRHAKSAGKHTALLEAQRPNLLTLAIANIEAYGEVTAELTYLDTVRYLDGNFSLRLPTTWTARYTPSHPDNPASSLPSVDTSSVHTRHTDDASLNTLSLHATLRPGFRLAQITSTSDAIDWQAFGEEYHVDLQQNRMAMDHDFTLGWRTAPLAQPDSAVFTETLAHETFTTLMLLPPQQRNTDSFPRELIFIIDSSGSMEGASMRQARASLLQALDRLTLKDRFNVIDFDDETRPLFDAPVTATDADLSQAIEFVNSLSADGGTDMKPALEIALADTPPAGYLRQVVFMTDGSVGNETELFQLIHRQLGDTRLFTVGIGSAPNSYFMRKAAEFGRGRFTYIDHIDAVQHNMTRLFRQLESPVLRDIQVQWPAGANAETFPNPLPDLYLGEPLILSARLQPVSGDIIIRGELNHIPWQQVLTLPEPFEQSTGLSRLWARQKIAWLQDQRLTGASEDATRPEILKLALAHQLVTQYTSFVAVDKTPVRPTSEALSKHAIPNRIVKGLPLPQTATSATESLYLGGLLCVLGLMYLGFLRKR